jgi:glucose-1-phosphate thymidylyltransferase
VPLICDLLGDGQQIGLSLAYAEQATPAGIAQAFLIGEEFIAESSTALILGDNIFYGHDLIPVLKESAKLKSGARVFAIKVQDPERYGVVEFDSNGLATSLEEKPKQPRSHWAVTGLYFYDGKVCQLAKSLKPSARGELEITDLNRLYLERAELEVTRFGRGVAWLDTGTFDSLLTASQFVQTIEQRQGLQVACIEEIAFLNGFINIQQLGDAAEKYAKSEYGQYLRRVIAEYV